VPGVRFFFFECYTHSSRPSVSDFILLSPPHLLVSYYPLVNILSSVAPTSATTLSPLGRLFLVLTTFPDTVWYAVRTAFFCSQLELGPAFGVRNPRRLTQCPIVVMTTPTPRFFAILLFRPVYVSLPSLSSFTGFYFAFPGLQDSTTSPPLADCSSVSDFRFPPRQPTLPVCRPSLSTSPRRCPARAVKDFESFPFPPHFDRLFFSSFPLFSD